MSESIEPGAASAADASVVDDGIDGLYLYGVVRREGEAGTALPTVGGAGEAEPIGLIGEDGLAAVVRRVKLTRSEDGALQLGLRDARQLEELVRRHNDIIGAIHRRRAILPAKFGSVYAREDDLRRALAAERHALLARIERLEDCDEWGIHLYADPAFARDHAREDRRVRDLEAELATATPGKAYLLKRRLADVTGEASRQALDSLARKLYDTLGRHAVAGRLIAPPRQAPKPDAELEILRASFLVKRGAAALFFGEIQTFVDAHPGMRYEYSGPWPPYSFADPLEGAAP